MFQLANTQSWTIASRRRCVHLPAAVFSCRALSLCALSRKRFPSESIELLVRTQVAFLMPTARRCAARFCCTSSKSLRSR